MDIKAAAFIVSLARYGEYPGMGLPEIAVAGRSNVGKSSLINRLCGRQGLAKVSGTPGKTRQINIFRINGAFHLIDLPGYGFASVSKAERLRWAEMMEEYFSRSGLLSHLLHLVDIRHEPTADDRDMNAFLRSAGLPFTLVATKADKISRGQRARHVHGLCRALGIQPWEVIPFSSESGEGRDALLERMGRVLGEEDGAASGAEGGVRAPT